MTDRFSQIVYRRFGEEMMPETWTIKRGESILDISKKFGISPEVIWNDPRNSALKEKRKSADVLYPGDRVCVPDKEEKSESIATGQKHTFRVKESLGLVIRLDVNPNDASSQDDRFILTSGDDSYRAVKTIKDDLVPGDNYVDLYYSGLKKWLTYTLTVHTSNESEPVTLFKDVAYEKLVNLSPQNEDDDSTQPDDSGDNEDGPYPEESDIEEHSSV